MPVHVCPGCGARNTDEGHCLVCGASLGSPTKALGAAIASSAALCGLWITVALLTGTVHSEVAIAFGALVSAATTRVSGGRGFGYQAVATAATVVGILIGHATVVWWFWEQLDWGVKGPPPRPPLRDFFVLLVEWDPIMAVFAVLGVLGGLWIWHEGGPSGD